MIILSEDITSLPAQRLNEVQVDMTMIGGKVEFERG
jgi:predicted amidohydrolase YtcJ